MVGTRRRSRRSSRPVWYSLPAVVVEMNIKLPACLLFESVPAKMNSCLKRREFQEPTTLNASVMMAGTTLPHLRMRDDEVQPFTTFGGGGLTASEPRATPTGAGWAWSGLDRWQG